jgi:putative oxidoreductase
MKIGRLLLRVVMGGLFVGHGTQKLFGWFGGNGLDATAQAFEHLGLRPAAPRRAAARCWPSAWRLRSLPRSWSRRC